MTPYEIAERAYLDARPVTKPQLRNYEVMSIDPLALGIKDSGIYDMAVEQDYDLAERFMLAHNIRYCAVRTWDPAWQEAEDRWFTYQWFDGQVSVIDKYFWDCALSVPDPEWEIGERG